MNETIDPTSSIEEAPIEIVKEKPKESCKGVCTIFQKLSLIYWKNAIVRKRHYVLTTLEILIPTIVFLGLALLVLSKPETVDKLTIPAVMDQKSLLKEALDFIFGAENARKTSVEIAYTPDNADMELFVKDFEQELKTHCDSCTASITWTPYPNEAKIEDQVEDNAHHQKDNTVMSDGFSVSIITQGLKISSSGKYGAENGNKITYKIRLVLAFVEDTKWNITNGCKHASKHTMIYAGIQKIIDELLIRKLSQPSKLPYQITTQRFPCSPKPNKKGMDRYNCYWLSIVMTYSFIIVIPTSILFLVSEKETGIKELMKMNGISNWMHFVGFMINSFVVLLISITIILVIFLVPFNGKNAVLEESVSNSIWWFIMFFYIISITTYCYFISSLFEKPTLAITVGMLLWIVSHDCIGLGIVDNYYGNLSFYTRLLFCLLPNVAMRQALILLCAFEIREVKLEDSGAQWRYLFKEVVLTDPEDIVALDAGHAKADPEDVDTVGNILFMLIISCIIFTLLGFYFENVLPTKFGVAKPWYFIFKPTTWGCKAIFRTEKEAILLKSEVKKASLEGESFEEILTDRKVGIEIIKLGKKFRRRTAVDEVSIKLYEGKIFCLLGHNGAGKTTTMHLLAGLLPPTSGTALIDGKDIRLGAEMNAIRGQIGFCPQENRLFEDLTVAEHLEFFGRLKGLSEEEAQNEADKLIERLELKEKTKIFAKSLSGGEKRKLSLGCAIIGNTKVLLLDECTSGLDPDSRRKIWDLLLEFRKDRTIVLASQSMEEADILGDRIAIMTAGRLQCCGSPSFLKNYYGTGYTLSLNMTEEGKPEKVLEKVKQHFPSSHLKSETWNGNVLEVHIAISGHESSTAQFPALFADLLPQQKDLKMFNIEISPVTMEEVFIKVDELGHLSDPRHSTNAPSSFCSLLGSSGKNVTGFKLVTQQFIGLFIKKYFYNIRNWKFTLSQFLLPIIMLIFAVISINSVFKKHEVESQKPKTFFIPENKDQVTYYFADGVNAEELGNHYAQVVGPSAKRETLKHIPAKLSGISQDRETKGDYTLHYIAAAEFEEDAGVKVNAMYNEDFIPLALNLVTNAILLKDTAEKYSLEVINQQLERTPEFTDHISHEPVHAAKKLIIIFGLFVAIGASILSATYVLMPVEESRTHVKQLQFMTGVNPLVYWGSAFLWDYFVFVLCAAMMVVCLYIFEHYERFTNNHGAGVFFLVLIVYGIDAISFSYLISLMANTPAGGFAFVILVNLCGVIMSTLVFLMEDLHTQTALVIGWISRVLFPSYGISKAMLTYARISTINSRCNQVRDQEEVLALLCIRSKKNRGLKRCCDNCLELGPRCFDVEQLVAWVYQENWQTNPPELPGILQELVWMFIMSCVYFGMLMLVEFGFFRRISNKLAQDQNLNFLMNTFDQNVLAEADRINDMVRRRATTEDCFVVNNLCKNYGDLSAVSKLTFGVHYGECFGLLGVNGAGKTTAVRMLTGDSEPSGGNAWIGNLSLLKNRERFIGSIGYCPQYDPIIEVLNGRQMLEMFARLRGVRRAKVTSLAKSWLDRFGLHDSQEIQCCHYSGGMRRRLSAAIALIGDPPIILLDEPTNGVDPVSRQLFWSIIESLKGCGGCIILGSQSMQECETLCSRLGILVNGEFQCFGRVKYLQDKFAQGYTLTIKLKPMASPHGISEVISNVSELYKPCSLKDHHLNTLQFSMHTKDMPLDEVFEIMETIKFEARFVVEDYSIRQTTMEEVFSSFAKKQEQRARGSSGSDKEAED